MTPIQGAFIACQLVLTFYNLGDAKDDAALIKANEKINHALNLFFYCLLMAGIFGLLFAADLFSVKSMILFPFSAFLNRQLFFDIALNKYRGLQWDYVTRVSNPGSVLDRIEISIFGYNGRLQNIIYIMLYITVFIILFL